MKSLRQAGCLGMSFGLVGLTIALGWVILRFSTPRPTVVLAGKVEDILTGRAPRLFSEKGEPFYVLNDDGELIALTARPVHIVRCTVRWQAVEKRFVDPCLGTRFTARGEYTGYGPPAELKRLPIEVRDGQVWVNLGY